MSALFTKTAEIKMAAIQALDTCKKHLASEGLVMPKESWLSGQAFALMVAKELGMFNEDIVLNDIDVFKPVMMDYALNEGLIRKMQNSASLEAAYKGPEWIGYSSKMKYKIVATDHIGLLNMTTVVFKGDVKHLQGEELGYAMIERFDINSTQCAINTSTMEVVYTEAFIEFLETKRLEITDLSTIGHSLIRVIKKSKEIGGAKINLEREFSKFVDENTQFVPYFGEAMYQKYKQNEKIFREYGVEAYEVDFKEKKYPLYKIRRTHSLIANSDIAILNNKISYGVAIASKLLKKYSIEQSLQLIKLSQDIEDEAFKGIEVSRGVMTSIYINDKDFDLNKFKYLCESIQRDIGHVYLVANNAESFTEALEYADVFAKNGVYVERYVYQEVIKQIEDKRESKITIKELLENLDRFNLDELLKETPKIGESDIDKPKIIGVVDNLFVTELDQVNEVVEIFGVTKKQNDFYWEEKKMERDMFLNSFKPLSESYIEAESFVMSGEALEYQDSIFDSSDIPIIDIDKEIPF